VSTDRCAQFVDDEQSRRHELCSRPWRKEVPHERTDRQDQRRLKQIEGKLTGDKVRVAQGTVEKTKGDVESSATRIVREAKRAVQRVKASLRRTR
jgi:uncharacterized protein YjbJ (UPF0337 family)